MANFCEHCKHAMSAHDNHASCPQCRVAAGDCSVDPKNPCTTCEGWTRKQWARLRRSLIDARARAEQRGKQHWTIGQPEVQVLVVQSQNEANMATSSTPTVRPLRLKVRLLVLLPFKSPLFNNWVRPLKVHVRNRNTAAQPYTAVPQPYNAAAQLYTGLPSRTLHLITTDMSFFRGSAEVPRFFKFLLGPEIFTNLQK